MDRQEESILLPTKTVVSDDGNTSVEGDLLWILYDEERMTFSFSMTNKTDIVLNEVRYSILAPNGKIYSGVANISEKNMELLSEKGSFKSEFDVFYPFTSGEYTAEVIFDYYDNLGEKHILNYVTSTKINN